MNPDTFEDQTDHTDQAKKHLKEAEWEAAQAHSQTAIAQLLEEMRLLILRQLDDINRNLEDLITLLKSQ